MDHPSSVYMDRVSSVNNALYSNTRLFRSISMGVYNTLPRVYSSYEIAGSISISKETLFLRNLI